MFHRTRHPVGIGVVGCVAVCCAIAWLWPFGGSPLWASGLSKPAAQGPRSARKLYPRDDSRTIQSFADFKARLLVAARRGEIGTIRASFANTVRVDFELSLSPERVIEHFGLRSGVPWRVLRDALELGAVKQDEDGEDIFIAPYVAAADPRVDPEDLAVTGSDVRVRAAPNSSAATVERLSYDLVSLGPDSMFDRAVFEMNDMPSDPAAWAQVITPSGKIGFVYGKYVRSPGDTRFVFKRANGMWKIVAIAAGD